LLLFLPMMVLLTISLPASQGFLRGWDLMGVIILRSTVSLLSVIWLVNVLPFDELLVTLRRWKCPAILTAMLSFMYRFSYIMWAELERMQTARRVRSFGRGSLKFAWRSRTQMLGMLLLRGLSRAERVHGAMCSRGWTGQIVHLDAAPTDNESTPQA
jgi:cobalt/nickel transport system permease protein